MTSNYFNPFFTVKCMDGLFISNQTATKVPLQVSQDQEFLANNKFGLIINTCPLEFKVPPIPNVYKVMNFHWQNSRGTMIDVIDIKIFKAIFDEIVKNLEEGHGVLVVSDRGHSRAITFVLLYLMWKFQWELFKALEYINSKRQNLQVRAAYLKLLVNYQKGLKIATQSAYSSNNDTSILKKEEAPQKHLSSQEIKQSIRPSNDKWSESRIKSPEEQLLSNTFRNTIKKRKINELNQECRESMAKQIREERKPQTNQKGNTTSKEWNKKTANNGSSNTNAHSKSKPKKSVKFSNQIEIIIKQSAVTQIFPQYEELSAEHLIEYERQSRTSKSDHVESIHSHQNPSPVTMIQQQNNSKGFNMQRPSEGRGVNEPSPSRKKDGGNLGNSGVPNVTNSRMINIRKMERVGSGLGGNISSSNGNVNAKGNFDNEFIILSGSQDSYSNEFYQSDVSKEEQKLNRLNPGNNHNEISHSSPLKPKQKKQQYFLKQPLSKQPLGKPKEQSSTTSKQNDASTNFKTQDLLNYQIRPSSLKKFKAIFIEEKQRKASSPKKKERKDDRVSTQPKYEHEFENPTLQEDLSFGQKSKRRLSGSNNQDQTYIQNDKFYQHKKSASTTMAMKMMGRFQKKGTTPIKNEKRCPTPQIITGQGQKEMRSSSHNNFFTRPLSRGGSNSLKMATKKSVTSSIEQQGIKNQQKPAPPVFNVNINVNIGKLEMFGTKNVDQRESLSRSSVNPYLASNNKQKLTKTHSHADKSQLLYNRMRSNSTNENYSKFSVSSTSVAEKQDSKGQKIGKERFTEKEGIKSSGVRQHTYQDKSQLIILNEDDNIFSGECFSKREIMQKINRKLLNKSRNQKFEEHTKKTSILQNNFI